MGVNEKRKDEGETNWLPAMPMRFSNRKSGIYADVTN